MHILALLPSEFWTMVVIIFGGIYMFVLVSLADAQASGGWGSFAKRYPTQTRSAGSAYSILSCWFCKVYSRGRGIRVIFTDTGIYFYRTLPSRLAHPPFLLPWESVKHVEKGHKVFGNFYLLEITDDAGSFRLELPERVENDLARYQKAAHGSHLIVGADVRRL